jgi:hypothetical protein
MRRFLLGAGAILLLSCAVSAEQDERFAKIDLNSDGRIDLEEHRASDEAEFRRIDANGDGKVTLAEYAAWLQTEMGFDAKTAGSVAACYVRHIDANRDGSISRDEMNGLNERIFLSLAGDDRLMTLEESKQTPPPDVLPPMVCG